MAPYARTTRYEEAFFSLENQGKNTRFARAPHDELSRETIFWKKWSITLNLIFLEKSLASNGFPIRCSKSVCLCFRMLSDNPELITMVLLSQTTPHEHPPTPAPCRWPALVTLLTPHQHVWRCHCDDVISISSFIFDRTLTAVCSTRGSHWS